MDFTKVIGQNKHGLYVIKHKNYKLDKYFIIEKYNAKMQFQLSKTISINQGQLVKIIVKDNNIEYFYKESPYIVYSSLFHNSLDSNLNISTNKKIIENIEFSKNSLGFKVEYEESRNNICIWYISQNEMMNFQITINYFEKGKIIKKQQFPFGKITENLIINDVLLTPKNDLFIVYNQEIGRNSVSQQSRLFCASINDVIFTDTAITLDKYRVTTANFSFNRIKNNVILSGTYGENEEINEGYFFINFKPSSTEIDKSVFEKIDRKLVTKVLGFKNEKKGENLNRFIIKKCIPNAQGGVLMIAERQFISTQNDVYYVNDIPQYTYAKVYSNEDVILFSLDSSGSLMWSDIILKNQTSVNDGGLYNGIITHIGDNQINIIYNDKLNANSDVIQVTYYADGTNSKKILLKNDQYFALILPRECKQVTRNSVVIPLNLNRNFTMLKLLYND